MRLNSYSPACLTVLTTLLLGIVFPISQAQSQCYIEWSGTNNGSTLTNENSRTEQAVNEAFSSIFDPVVPEGCGEVEEDYCCSATADLFVYYFACQSGLYEITHMGVSGDWDVLCNCTDEDGDGYSVEGGGCGEVDCDDDPSDDPAICDTCSCGVAECAPCARCIYPGAIEFPGDGVDSDCNQPDYDAVANSIAASYGSRSLVGSGISNQLALLLIPTGAVIFLRIMRRKK